MTRPTATTRLRLSIIEKTDVYRWLYGVQAWKKSGTALLEICSGIANDIKALQETDPYNRYRRDTASKITSDHVMRIMKGVMAVRIPPPTWKYKTTVNEEGVQVPALKENGEYDYELDEDGQRILNPSLPAVRELFVKQLIALKEKIRQQNASTERTASEARSRARQVRELRNRASAKRRTTYMKNQRKVRKRVRHDRKRENTTMQVDRRFKRVVARSAMEATRASVSMATSVGALVSHLTEQVQHITTFASLEQIDIPPSPAMTASSSSDFNSSEANEENDRDDDVEELSPSGNDAEDSE